MKRFAELYVSERHRANPGKGCVVAALAGEAACAAPEPRSAFTSAVGDLLASIEGLSRGVRAGNTRRRALAALATAVGALVLSRAIDDEALAEELLEAARLEIAR